jgi:hypothetical protein
MTITQRLERMLAAGYLDEISAPDADVAALWHKALTSARDADHGSMSSDNQYVLGYQALLQMGTAILSCAGFRTRGSQGHHANTFLAVAALGIVGLEEIEIATERIRKMRKTSAYEPGSVSLQQLGALKKLISRVMPPAQRWLAAERPGVAFPAYESG